MSKPYAHLSGVNRLSCVQAKAIRDSNRRYRDKYEYDFGPRDYTLISATDKIYKSIHKGRLANLSGNNKLTVDEVWVLMRRVKLLISTGSYANGYEKRAIEKALPMLRNSVTKSRSELRGKRNRLEELGTRVGDEDDDIYSLMDKPQDESTTPIDKLSSIDVDLSQDLPF